MQSRLQQCLRPKAVREFKLWLMAPMIVLKDLKEGCLEHYKDPRNWC